MNTIYNFLTQTYVPAIPNGMIVLAVIAVAAAAYTLTKAGLIRHFINYGK